MMVMKAESIAAFLYLLRIWVHAGKVLDLGREGQLRRVRHQRKGVHGIQKRGKRDSGRPMKNEKVVHGAEFRKKPRKFKDVVA